MGIIFREWLCVVASGPENVYNVFLARLVMPTIPQKRTDQLIGIIYQNELQRQP